MSLGAVALRWSQLGPFHFVLDGANQPLELELLVAHYGYLDRSRVTLSLDDRSVVCARGSQRTRRATTAADTYSEHHR